MSSLFREEDIGPGAEAQAILGFVIGIMMQNPDRAEELCTLANEDELEAFGVLLDELSPVDLGAEEATARQDLADPSSQPTFIYPRWGLFVYDDPEYSIINADDQISIVLVRAQDRAGPIYDEERFVLETKEIGERYKGAGTGVPASYFFSEYSIGYYWPKAVPLPPAGNSFITGTFDLLLVLLFLCIRLMRCSESTLPIIHRSLFALFLVATFSNIQESSLVFCLIPTRHIHGPRK